MKPLSDGAFGVLARADQRETKIALVQDYPKIRVMLLKLGLIRRENVEGKPARYYITEAGSAHVATRAKERS